MYARRRPGGGFIDNTMRNFHYTAAVPGIVIGMVGDRYLLLLSDIREVVVLGRTQVWVTSYGGHHRLALD